MHFRILTIPPLVNIEVDEPPFKNISAGNLLQIVLIVDLTYVSNIWSKCEEVTGKTCPLDISFLYIHKLTGVVVVL